MNVYDEAHNLAQAMKESNEFKEFDRLRQEVEKDEQLSSMLRDFQDKQMQMQAAQFTGQEPDEDLVAQVQSIATMIATKPLAAQYIQAQGTFSVMVNDVFGIVGEAIGIK